MQTYHLEYLGRPLCDHMACVAGLMMCEAVKVDSCGYRSLRKARAAKDRLNGREGYAGSARVRHGPCPHADL